MDGDPHPLGPPLRVCPHSPLRGLRRQSGGDLGAHTPRPPEAGSRCHSPARGPSSPPAWGGDQAGPEEDARGSPCGAPARLRSAEPRRGAGRGAGAGRRGLGRAAAGSLDKEPGSRAGSGRGRGEREEQLPPAPRPRPSRAAPVPSARWACGGSLRSPLPVRPTRRPHSRRAGSGRRGRSRASRSRRSGPPGRSLPPSPASARAVGRPAAPWHSRPGPTRSPRGRRPVPRPSRCEGQRQLHPQPFPGYCVLSPLTRDSFRLRAETDVPRG